VEALKKKVFWAQKKFQITLTPEKYSRLHETTRETSGRKGKTAHLKTDF
jgi:hypothetical protein